jgi:hypothetical protein
MISQPLEEVYMNKKTEKLLNGLLQCAIMTAAVVAVTPAFAQAAAGDFGTTVTNFETNTVGVVPQAIAVVSYVGGIGMMIGGAMGLKQHAENPSSNKISPPIGKLLVGAGLVGLPALTKWVASSSQLTGAASHTTWTW